MRKQRQFRHGFNHDRTHFIGVPAIFDMNFQTPNIFQKPLELQAVQQEQTPILPGLGW